MGQVSTNEQKLGSQLVVLLLVVGFISFAWQAIRPLVFNTDMYDFNSYYISAYATQKGLDPYNVETLQSLAQELNIPKVTDYTYLPFNTLLFLPLSFLPYPAAVVVWRLLNLALLVFAVWLISKTLALSLNAKAALIVGVIVFNFDPLIYNLAIGQINLLILLLIVGTAYAWTRHREVLAGVLLALGVSIKLAPAVLFLYFLWKRGFRLVAASIAAIIAFAVIAFLALGEQATRKGIASIVGFAQEDNAWIANQSWRGFLARLFVGDEYISALYPAARLESVLYFAGVLVIVVLTAFVLYRSRRSGLFHLEFALVLIAFTLISPVTWVHHLVWLLYPLVVLAVACVDRKQIGPIVFLAIGYALIAFPLDYRNERVFQWPEALWVSTKFYGLVVLYAVNAWLLLRAPSGDSVPVPDLKSVPIE
jgi:hypothetical protein